MKVNNMKKNLDSIVEVCGDCNKIKSPDGETYWMPTDEQRESVYETYTVKNVYCKPCLRKIMGTMPKHDYKNNYLM